MSTDPPGAARPGPLPSGQSRAALVAEVERALVVARPGVGVVVAVSGGPDSAALAFLVTEARPDLAVTLGHVRHHLRDDAADVAAATRQAAWLGRPLQIIDVTVEPAGQGVEAAARTQRYAALRGVVAAAGARWLVVGHTADDQAETALLRLARGTGVRGLAAMAPASGDILRPLLRLRRADVRAFVAGEGLVTAADPTNIDPVVRRVVVRTRVLPALADVAADPVGALARLADLARIDADHLDAAAAAACGAVVQRYGICVAARTEALGRLGPAILTRVVRGMVAAVRGDDPAPTTAQVFDVLALASGAMLDLPGVRFSRGGGWLAAAPPVVTAPAPRPLPVPGSVPWDAADLRVAAVADAADDDGQLALAVGAGLRRPRTHAASGALPPGGREELADVIVHLTVDEAAHLVVRTRQAGDRMRTLAGTRKLQDLFVDAHVPRLARDLVPVVTVAACGGAPGADRVVWVPGVGVAQSRPNDPAAVAVRLYVAPAGDDAARVERP